MGSKLYEIQALMFEYAKIKDQVDRVILSSEEVKSLTRLADFLKTIVEMGYIELFESIFANNEDYLKAIVEEHTKEVQKRIDSIRLDLAKELAEPEPNERLVIELKNELYQERQSLQSLKNADSKKEFVNYAMKKLHLSNSLDQVVKSVVAYSPLRHLISSNKNGVVIDEPSLFMAKDMLQNGTTNYDKLKMVKDCKEKVYKIKKATIYGFNELLIALASAVELIPIENEYKYRREQAIKDYKSKNFIKRYIDTTSIKMIDQMDEEIRYAEDAIASVLSQLQAKLQELEDLGFDKSKLVGLNELYVKFFNRSFDDFSLEYTSNLFNYVTDRLFLDANNIIDDLENFYNQLLSTIPEEMRSANPDNLTDLYLMLSHSKDDCERAYTLDKAKILEIACSRYKNEISLKDEVKDINASLGATDGLRPNEASHIFEDYIQLVQKH